MTSHTLTIKLIALVGLVAGCHVEQSRESDFSSVRLQSLVDAGQPGIPKDAALPGVPSNGVPLPPINPCAAFWQHSEFHPAPVPPDIYQQCLAQPPKEQENPDQCFELALDAGRTVWIGGDAALRTDRRAIVEVDIFVFLQGAIYDLVPPRWTADSHLWFVAIVPMTNDPPAIHARQTVNAYQLVEPVKSEVLGYCFGNVFWTQPMLPGCVGTQPDFEVVKYDPKCVCRDAIVTGEVAVSQ